MNSLIVLPCPFVSLLDRGYDILNGYAEWDGLHEAIPQVRALIENERSHVAIYEHFALYFPAIREIRDSLESRLNELEGVLLNMEQKGEGKDRDFLSSMLSAFEENAVTLTSLQHALERSVDEIPRHPPLPTTSDAIFVLSCVLRGEVSQAILPCWLSGLGEFRKHLAMDLAAIRFKSAGNEKLIRELGEVIALLGESEDLFSSFEREKNTQDIEQLIAVLGKAGEKLCLILPEMEESSSNASTDLKSRYINNLSLLINRYQEGNDVVNEIRDYVVYLKEIEEKRLESLEKDKNYWFLYSYRQEDFFSALVQCCGDKVHLLEKMNLYLHDPLELSRLFSQYSSLSDAERGKMGELKRELEEDSFPENARYFKNLFNIVKNVFQCRLPIHHLETHNKHALMMQRDFKSALTDSNLLKNESSENVDALLQALKLQEEGAGKIKEFLQRREKDLLIEGKNLMIRGVKMIKAMELNYGNSDSAVTPTTVMLRKFNLIPDEPKYLVDFREDQSRSSVPEVRKEVMRENLQKLEKALKMRECNEISSEDEKKVFMEFLLKLNSIQSQLEDQVKTPMKSLNDAELEKTSYILMKVISEFRIITEEIVRLIEEGNVPPALQYCSRIEEIAGPLDELQQIISEILEEKQKI